MAMTPGKRLFDLVLAIALALVLALPFALLLVLLRWQHGPSVFYISERMRTPDRPFRLWKLRTMTLAASDNGVSGGDKAARITPIGRFLRRSRLDEVPQLWNILKGDMSFVGPRPPLRTYVDRFPALYAQVLHSRPGVTGLATLIFHRHEEDLLATCTGPAETDAVYARRCVPRKARIDLIYQRRRTVWLDCAILLRTLRRAVNLGR